jgi:hypothetical protein
MTMLALLALSGALQDDAAAAKLLGAAQDRISSAKTLRATIEFSMTRRAQPKTRLTLMLKGETRWRTEVEGGQNFGIQDSSLGSDGRVVRSLKAGGPARASVLTEPAAGGVEIRDALRTSALPFLLMLQNPRFAMEAPGGPLSVDKIKDGGAETVDGRELRVVNGAITLSRIFGRQAVSIKILIDPAGPRVVRREILFPGNTILETLDPWAVDEEIPDAEFAFQTLKRLNRARAEQAAVAVDLFTRYTGRLPRALGELAARPAWLEPDVFFPAGGFVLEALPGDPWGRPFELTSVAGRPVLAGRGADGRPGGHGDAEDAAVPLRAPTGRAIGAPSDRLRRHFETRVRLQLLAGAVRAYSTSYGDLPRKKADLWEKPESAEVWPAGGWMPAGLPKDGWGDPLRLISEETQVRAQCADPKARRIGAKNLTPEEREGLAASAGLRVSAEEKEALFRLMDDLREEDFEKREKTDEALRAKGPSAIGPLEERMKSEKDVEARARLGMIRKSLHVPAASWPAELGPLVASVRLSGDASEGGQSAVLSLKTLASAEADFRGNDRDNNKIQDFWTGDVAGLYALRAGGEMLKLIEMSVAGADAAPLNDGAALEGVVERAAKSGYLFRAMTHDGSSTPPDPYNKGANRHPSKFGFCAYPEEYGAGGTMTAIISEGNTVFLKDTGGEPLLEWPSDEELRTWTKAD